MSSSTSQLPPPRSILLSSPSGAQVLLAKATFALSAGQIALADEPADFLERDERDGLANDRLLRPSDAVERPSPFAVVRGRVQVPVGQAPLVARVVLGSSNESVELGRERMLEEVTLAFEVASLAPRTLLIIEGLHPVHPVFITAMPSIVPVAAVRRGERTEERMLAARVLFIDVDRSLCTIAFAANVGWDANGPLEFSLAWREIGLGEPEAWSTTETEDPDMPRQQTVQLELPEETFDTPEPRRRTQEVATESARVPVRGLPFVHSGQAAAPRQPPPTPARPTRSASKEPAAPAAPRARLPSTQGLTYGQAAVRSNPMMPTAISAPPRPPAMVTAERNAALSQATQSGALAASDAAADVVPPPQPSESAVAVRSQIRSVRMIFIDESYIERVLEHDPWKGFVIAAPVPAVTPPVKRGEAPPPPPEPESDRDKRQRNLRSIVQVLEAAADDEGLHRKAEISSDGDHAPLCLISGTLELPFDEVELLRETTDAATPLGKTDKRLKDLLDASLEVLKLPLSGTPDFSLQLVHQVRDAWLKANRSFPPTFLVNNVEFALLEKRAHPKREVLGGPKVRLALRVRDVSIPAYVEPAALSNLPLTTSLPVRLLAEVHPRQDSRETASWSLRIVAIGRLGEAAKKTEP